jgi:hypothetical protein
MVLHVRAEQSQIPGIRFDSHENNIAKQDPGEIYFGNTVR